MIIIIYSIFNLCSLVSLLSAGEPGRSQDNDKQKLDPPPRWCHCLIGQNSPKEVGLTFKLKIWTKEQDLVFLFSFLFLLSFLFVFVSFSL